MAMSQQIIPQSVKNKLRFITAKTEQSVPDGNGAKKSNQGSGVMYCYKGHTYLLTAAHCVVDATKNPVNVECKTSVDPVNFKTLRILRVLPSVFDTENGLDYAILEIENPNNEFLREDSVRLANFSTSSRIDLPTVTYGFLHWCREGRCFDVKSSDEGLYWEVDVPADRKEGFKQLIEGLSGAGVFNFAAGYFECLGVFKHTRDNCGVGHDVAITNALVFQGLIDESLSNNEKFFSNPSYSPLPDYISRHCVQHAPNDFMRLVRSDSQRFTLSDYISGTVDVKESIRHYVLVASAQAGKSHELKQTCYSLSQSEFYVCFISVDKESHITRDIFPKKEILESGKKVAIVIDAIDESSVRNFQSNLDIIKEFAKVHPLIPMVVSCRSGFLKEDKLEGFINVYFEDLSWGDICAYVNQTCSNPSSVLGYLNQPEVRELCVTPLGLRSILKIIDKPEEMPRTKSALYAKIIEQHKREKREISSEEFSMAKEGLDRIAVFMMLTDKQQLSKTEIVTVLDGNTGWTGYCLDYYDLLIENDGLYYFENHAYKEYLSAAYLSRKDIKKVQKIVCYEGTSRIKPQLYNVVMLWLQLLSESGEIQTEIWDWISAEGSSLLLGCDKARINDDLRLKTFELILQDCKRNNHIYGFFYTNCYQTLYSFVETSDLRVVDYLIEELRNEQMFDSHLYDVLSLSACIDWDFLKGNAADMYSKIIDLLFSKIQKYAGSEDTIACFYFLCVNKHFYGNEHYLEKTFGLIGTQKDVDSINALCMMIGEGGWSDNYVDYLFYVEPILHQTGTRIVSRKQLYVALSSVKTSENISRVISFITNSDFLNRETDDRDYYNMLDKLIASVKNWIEQGEKSVMKCIDDSFNALYLYDGSYFAGILPTKVLPLYNEFYNWSNREDMLKVINDMQNRGRIDDAELQKIRENSQKLFEEMCNYETFKTRIHEVVENNSNVKSISQIHFIRDGRYDNYVAHFFILHSNYNSFNTQIIKQAIDNQWKYELFRFYMIGEVLLGRDSYVEINSEHIEQCILTANKIIDAILNNQKNCNYSYIQQTIKLIITGKITIENEKLLGLLPYSYESAEIKDNGTGWGNDTKSLFAFIAERFQVSELLPVIKTNLQEKCRQLQEPVILYMCKYVVVNGTKEDVSLIFNSLHEYKGNTLSDMILETLLERKDIIGEIIGNIPNMDNGSILTVASRLIEDEDYRIEMIRVLESKLPELEGYEFRRALSLLVSSGSICALEYIKVHQDLLKDPFAVYEFKYYEIKALQLLLDILPQSYKKDDMFNMNVSHIIQSIGNIAEESEENYNIVKTKIEELVNSYPDLDFLLRHLPIFYERYLKKHEGVLTIESAVSLLTS